MSSDVQGNEAELASTLTQAVHTGCGRPEWCQERADLHHWMDVLNMFDTVLQKHVPAIVRSTAGFGMLFAARTIDSLLLGPIRTLSSSIAAARASAKARCHL
jgi:hypothetical protein